MKRAASTKLKESGVALIELSLAIPVAIALTFLTIDIAQSIQHLQISATLSREAATLAMRDCAGDRGSKLTFCLRKVRDQIQTYAGYVVDDAEVIVSMFVYDNSESGSLLENATSYQSGRTSKYQLVGSNIEGLSADSNYLVDKELVVIGEVYVPYKPFIPAFPAFSGLIPELYHDATVL